MATLTDLSTQTVGAAGRFVELIARSNFSFLQGASHPEEMTEEAIRHGYRGISICDLNGLYGVVRGYQTANAPSLFTASVEAKPDFRYHFGSELTLIDGTAIVFTPMNVKGYANLCQLLTKGKRNVAKYFSQVTLQQVFEHQDGLLAFPLPPYTEDRFLELREVFHDRLYLPVWRDLTWESLEFARQAFALEEKFSAQLFVTQRPLMHANERKPLFDVLTCIHHHTTLEEAAHILTQNSERYLRPLADLDILWRDRPDLLSVTLEIAERIDFQLDQIRYRYPESKLPPGLSLPEYLRQLCQKGLYWRFPEGAPLSVQVTLNKELQLIRELEFEDYFITLYDICKFADEKGILYQGRGSAANSVVCFCLGLTAVNPTQIDLLFERFLSKERGEPPDIDIDFENARREEVIQHIYETYDAEHAAMVCTIIRFKSRLAIRETAKVLGFPLKTINALIQFMGRDGFRRLVDDETLHERFHVEKWRWQALLALAKEIHGFPRHLGIHTGGFLITHDPITQIVPVEKATMNGRYVIQWNKDDINDLKLMKIDVLALGMLTALRRCLQLLHDHKGISGDLAQLPAEDPATYEMISRADTIGVFQIESRAQMQTLPRLQPRHFYDLVVEIALIRPGPLQGGMVHPYLRRRKGLEKVEYPHRDLEPVLKKTMGVPIFQEQVMKIAVVAAGFTPGEADELRRIMSSAWRKRGTMDGVRERLVSGMQERGIKPSMIEQIYRTIEGFASYGFPESHSASFALLTYASCYIKCHHPDVFVCALLNSQPMGFYPPRVLIQDAQRHGVSFLPVDIQHSEVEYTLTAPDRSDSLYHAVRVGLLSIQSVHREEFEKITHSRSADGPFLSLQDLVRRTQISKSTLRHLAKAGALQCFGFEPRRLLWMIESLSLDPQSFLWGQAKENPNDRDSHLPFESNWDSLRREYETSGYSLDRHPMGVLRSALESQNANFRELKLIPYCLSKDLGHIPSGRKIRVAGMVSITQRPPTAKGMCFITLEDEHGFINVVVPPDVYQKDRLTIYGKGFLEVQGELEKNESIINLKAFRVLPLYF